MQGQSDLEMSYPRICAHRGFNTVAPEGTLPAYAAAVALGADEIEVDIWPTKDGDIMVFHDRVLDRTTDGHGRIMDLTTKEVLALDAGSWYSPRFAGCRIAFFEEVLERFASQVLINIHIKPFYAQADISQRMRRRLSYQHDVYVSGKPLMPPLPAGIEETFPEVEAYEPPDYDEKTFARLLDLLDKHHARDRVYIAGTKDVLRTALRMAPDITRDCIEGDSNYTIVENALRYKCKKLQFIKLFLTQRMIDEAHRHGLTCNMFWADDPAEAAAFQKLGIDTILTNNFLNVKRAFSAL